MEKVAAMEEPKKDEKRTTEATELNEGKFLQKVGHARENNKGLEARSDEAANQRSDSEDKSSKFRFHFLISTLLRYPLYFSDALTTFQ